MFRPYGQLINKSTETGSHQILCHSSKPGKNSATNTVHESLEGITSRAQCLKVTFQADLTMFCPAESRCGHRQSFC